MNTITHSGKCVCSNYARTQRHGGWSTRKRIHHQRACPVHSTAKVDGQILARESTIEVFEPNDIRCRKIQLRIKASIAQNSRGNLNSRLPLFGGSAAEFATKLIKATEKHLNKPHRCSGNSLVVIKVLLRENSQTWGSVTAIRVGLLTSYEVKSVWRDATKGCELPV